MWQSYDALRRYIYKTELIELYIQRVWEKLHYRYIPDFTELIVSCHRKFNIRDEF
jgi:hypothetical protein